MVLAIVLASVLSFAAIWLCTVIILFNLKRRAIRTAAEALSGEDVEHVLSLIERIGDCPSQGHIGVVRHPVPAEKSRIFILPRPDPAFPWGGLAIRVSKAAGRGGPPVNFQIEHDLPEGLPDDEVIRWLAVPRMLTGKGNRRQNVFAPDRYLKLSPPLREQLEKLYPEDPRALLSCLLTVTQSIEGVEPFNQLRCGLPPGWIQRPRFHKCPNCRRPLRLIVQVPGSLLSSRLAEGTFYFLGCPTHPAETVTDQDWG